MGIAMNKMIDSDQLHRLVKLALDTGEVQSLEVAEQLFAGYRLGIEVGYDVATSPTLQAAVLTAVNIARRSFLGGVYVSGNLAIPLCVPWGQCQTLREAVIDLHGQVVQHITPDLPLIVIGGEEQVNYGDRPFAVRATFDGWAGGVIPLDGARRLPEQQECVPAGILAGALAISEAFQFVRGGNVVAGHRDVGLSLWRPEPEVSWLVTNDRGPVLERLPSRLWLIGLGHLGQAFLWTLGLLPYVRSNDVTLVLQDYDTIVMANDSTSLLTTSCLVGEKKTRAMARWCESRGFRTTILERRFADNFNVASNEPGVALCGVDNALARSVLEDVGFPRIVEAGLGAGPQEYLSFQIHTFPASREAKKLWSSERQTSTSETLLGLPAYRALADAGADECGLTTLAGRTVGASFVGTVTATLVIAEVLRMMLEAHSYEVIDGSLRSLEHRQALAREPHAPFNPGATPAA